MKTIKIALLALFLAAALVMNASAATFTPGTYEAVAAGRNGDITLQATFSEDAITGLSIGHEETPGVGLEAIDALKDQTMATQAIPTDTITGTTVSSTAFITALTDAVIQAGGDPADMQATEVAPVEAEALEYDTEADLIVVGGGAAGMTAAVTAHDLGLKVILLEKSVVLGGNTPAAANGVNAANAKVQVASAEYQAAEASVEGLVNLQTQNELARENLVRAFAENSGEVIDWLSDMGVEFTVDIQKDDRNPVQNYYMLKAEADGSTGITMTNAVKRALEERGITVYMAMDATELVRAENGAINGVIAIDGAGNTVTFTGRAILLATGGFGHNTELLAQANPKLANATTDEIAPTTGEGLIMARAVGAKAVDLEYIQTFPVVMEGYGMVTPNKLPGGFGVNAVIVNQDAQRFIAEGFEIGDAILAQPEGAAYMIFREDQISEPMQNIINAGYVAFADTPKELGKVLGLDGDALQATVDAYNADVADGTDDAFGKQDPLPLEGKLYGFRYGVGAHYFMGGILIDEYTHVLSLDESPIPGLYAAGECTGGFHGSQRIDGSGIGDSFTFGRIAGNSIAATLAE